MKDSQALLESQFSFFGFHLSRLKCLSCLVCSLVQLRAVNLSELSLCFGGSAQRSSVFRRIQRFLAEVTFPFDLLSGFVWERFQGDGAAVLSLDRTNWKFGRLNINILMLSICREGFAVPLMWKVLGNKRGNSSQAERIGLMERFVSVINTDQVVRLVADREFIGKDWLEWLDAHYFHYVIRIRANQYLEMGPGKPRRAASVFSHEQWKALRKPRAVAGTKAYAGGMKLKTGDHLVLISNLPLKGAPSCYAKRWGIEVLFAAPKKRGFNFENTHITKPERINNFIALLSIALVWAVIVGEWLVENGREIPVKKHRRKAISVFRLGLDLIRWKLLNNKDLDGQVQLLSCT